MPGKGTQMAIVELLDTISYQLKSGMCVLVVFYDMSNAFCTFPAEKVIQIARNFGICGTMEKLLIEYLDQSTSVVKMSDSRGFYLSEKFDTKRGCQQGQIGSDFIFTMLNDGIRPIQVSDEYIQRIKYVDDFADIIAHKSEKVCFDSLSKNLTRIKQQATSVGLKLNESKTQIISANIPENKLESKYNYLPSFKYLGYIGETSTFYGKPTINGDAYVDKIIAELNASVLIIRAMKRTSSIFKRVDAATKLIWSRCGNIGIAYAYSSSQKWKSLCIAMKRLVKSAGLDSRMHDDDVFRISTRLEPRLMARKQILQLGLKFIDPEQVSKKRYNLSKDQYRDKVFMSLFYEEYCSLDSINKRYIIDQLKSKEGSLPKKMINIKGRLKTHYRKKSILGNIPKLSILRNLISKNIKKCFESKKSGKIISRKNTTTRNINIAERPGIDCEKPRNFRMKAMHRKAVKRKKILTTDE